MITVTITAERAEGKTILALIISKLLKALTNYQVELRETNIPNDAREQITRSEYPKLEDLKNLKARNVTIVVVNTNHYPPRLAKETGIDFGDI